MQLQVIVFPPATLKLLFLLCFTLHLSLWTTASSLGDKIFFKQVQQIDCISHVYAHSDGLKVRLPFVLSLTHLVNKYYNFSDEHASISLMAQCVSKELAKDIWSVSCELNTASVIFSVR